MPPRGVYKAKSGQIEVEVPAILSPERHVALLDALAATSTTDVESLSPEDVEAGLQAIFPLTVYPGEREA